MDDEAPDPEEKDGNRPVLKPPAQPQIPFEVPDVAPVLPGPSQIAKKKAREVAEQIPLPPVIPFPTPVPNPEPVPVRPAAIRSGARTSHPFSDFVRERVNSPKGRTVAKATAAAQAGRRAPSGINQEEEVRGFLHNTVLGAAGATSVAAVKALSSGPPGGPPQGPTAEVLSSVRVAETLQAREAGRRRRKRSKEPVGAEGGRTLVPHGIPRPSQGVKGGTSSQGEDAEEGRRVTAKKVAIGVAAAAGLGATVIALKGGPPSGGGFHTQESKFRPGKKGSLNQAF